MSIRPYITIRLLMALAALYVLACLPILNLGYGADHDAWLVARSALDLASGKGYVPSRMPGYPLYELLQAALIPWGGWLASNLASLIATAVCAALFWRILALRGECGRLWALAFFVLHPFVLKNALTTMDYNFALLFIVAAYLAFLEKRHLAAGAALGLAVGCRITSALFLLPLAWTLSRERRGWRAFFALALVGGALGAAAFTPLFLKYRLGFLFFEVKNYAGMVRWALAGAYRAVSYCGPFATLAIVVALASSLWQRREAWRNAVADTPFLAIVIFAALFLWKSDETDYLVILTPFLALFLPRVVAPRWWRAIVVLTVLHGIVTLDLVGGESGQRFFQPRLTLGVLPSDAFIRLRYQRLRDRLGQAGVADKPTLVLAGISAIDIDNPRLVRERARTAPSEIALSRFKGTNVYVTYKLTPEELRAIQAKGWRVGYLSITRGNLINSFGYDPAAEGCFEIDANALAGLPNAPIKKR